MQGLMQGKRGLIMGVANDHSIAWGIAKALAAQGAELAFTYQGERIEGNVRELAATVSSPLVTECDVRSDDDIARVFAEVGEAFGGELAALEHVLGPISFAGCNTYGQIARSDGQFSGFHNCTAVVCVFPE